jgi:alpha-beta hydrolase superfamily lysophospholipase
VGNVGYDTTGDKGRQGVATLPDLRFGAAPLPEPFPGYDPGGDAAALILPGTPSPARLPIPGVQYAGSLGHGQRFFVSVPRDWNGKLAVCGTPAMRSEHANDAILGDYLLARGYAYAAGNKAIPYNAVIEPPADSPCPELSYVTPFPLGELAPGSASFRFGALYPERGSLTAWHEDLAAVIRAATEVVQGVNGRAPARTYALGLSMGGGQVRWLLERHPELVDGGLEWAAVYWTPQRNILAYLPAFLRHMPAYVASGYRDRAAHDAIVAAGFPPDRLQPEGPVVSLWDAHYSKVPPFYGDLTSFAFGKLLDPGADLATLEARAAYVPGEAVRRALEPMAHSGAIGRPLISIAGEADVFITPEHNAQTYLEAVRSAGAGDRYWQYIVRGGPHVDSFAAFGWQLQPQLPFAWAAFERLERLVEHGELPAGAGSARQVGEPREISA